MTVVQTVRGPIDTADLGRVLMHEHVFVLSEFRINYPEYWDEEERVADAIRRLGDLKARGVDTIVDPTVLGLGRCIPRIQRVADAADINIIAATGLYTYHDMPFFLRYRGPGTLLGGEEPMVEMFTRDITEGIAGTGVNAAFLKCAIEADGMTPGVERVMRAVARTHRATGAPITVHTNVDNRSGLLAQKLLAEEGVDLSRVVLGHSGDAKDLDYLAELADAGSLLGMDRFGIDLAVTFDQRVDTVAEMCRRGYAANMVLSQDASCFIDWFPADITEQAAPNWHYNHISDDVLWALRERGVPDEQIDTMLVDNPRRYFENVGAY